MDSKQRIAASADIPDDDTFLITVRESKTGTTKEGVLIRNAAGITGWLNYCQHMLDVKLDRGSGAVIRDDEIVCTTHGAMFDTKSGECTYGPCKGAYLTSLAIAEQNGSVYLTDSEYEFVETGPIESTERYATSTTNIEF